MSKRLHKYSTGDIVVLRVNHRDLQGKNCIVLDKIESEGVASLLYYQLFVPNFGMFVAFESQLFSITCKND
jgi:hypothetical protein